MIIVISMLSFLLDGLLSRYLSPNSLFLPLFTIVSLVLIYPYYKGNDYRYLKYSAIIGLLYDIAYANTIFYHFFLFIILGFIVIFFFYFLSNTWYINLLISITVIISYRLIDYIFLVLFKNIHFSFTTLLKSIYQSLLLNIIYCLFIFIITYHYRKKHKIVTK